MLVRDDVDMESLGLSRSDTIDDWIADGEMAKHRPTKKGRPLIQARKVFEDNNK